MNLRTVRLQLQRQYGEFEEMTCREGRDRRGRGVSGEVESAVKDCEARRDCNGQRRDEILSEKNEQNVSDRGGWNGGRDWRGRFAVKKRVDCSPDVSRVGRAGVNE